MIGMVMELKWMKDLNANTPGVSFDNEGNQPGEDPH
jgi:hypothetical protein